MVAALFALTLGDMALAAPHRLKSDEKRLSIIRPEAEGSLRLEPTFVCCGLEFGARNGIPGLKVEYRKCVAKGDAWNAVDGKYVVHSPRTMDYRLSLRDLAEDTEYEVRLVDGSGKTVKTGRFRTWKSDVPIARTVLLDASGPLPKTISAIGSPSGWIRYTAAPGTVLDFGEGSEDCVNVTGAKYVLFDDIVAKGTFGRRVFNVTDSSHVRFRNCNISRWGRVGKPRFDKKGRLFDPSKAAKRYGINFDGAIEIGRGCDGVVVERCYIHDPRGRANSWFYSHPAGPEAVVMAKPNGSTVLRWNDFVGSDWHRFNDAVESAGNFSENGGFNRDGVYYLMIHGMGSTRLMVSVDGATPEPSKQQVAGGYPTWTMIAPGRKFGDMICPLRFKAGRHTLGMSAKWGEFRYDGIVLTDSPGSFEPR